MVINQSDVDNFCGQHLKFEMLFNVFSVGSGFVFNIFSALVSLNWEKKTRLFPLKTFSFGNSIKAIDDNGFWN